MNKRILTMAALLLAMASGNVLAGGYGYYNPNHVSQTVTVTGPTVTAGNFVFHPNAHYGIPGIPGGSTLSGVHNGYAFMDNHGVQSFHSIGTDCVDKWGIACMPVEAPAKKDPEPVVAPLTKENG